MSDTRELRQEIDWLQGQIISGDNIVEEIALIRADIGALTEALQEMAEGIDKNTKLFVKAIDDQNALLNKLVDGFNQIGATLNRALAPRPAPPSSGMFDDLGLFGEFVAVTKPKRQKFKPHIVRDQNPPDDLA